MTETLYSLQFLRVVAAYLVVSMHTTQAISIRLYNTPDDFWGMGSIGVDIFFVISGFVMEYLSKDQVNSNFKSRFRSGLQFLQRRIVRVVPMYWIFTTLKILLLVALPALAIRTSLEPYHILSSYLFLPYLAPWGHIEPVLPVGWTLNFEMLFYVIFAAGILFTNSRIIFVGVAFLIIHVANMMFNSIQLEFYAQDIVFEFLLGILIAALYKKSILLTPPYGFSLIAIGLAFIFFDVSWFENSRFIRWGLASGLIVYGFICIERLINKIPSFVRFSKLGDAAYSTYLFHTFVVPAVVITSTKMNITNALIIFCLSILFTAIGSQLVHKTIELPMTNWLKSKISIKRAST